MALLFIDSFDHYQTADLTEKWTSKYINPTIAALGRCEGQCVRFPAIGNIYKGVSPNTTFGTAGFAMYVEHTLYGINFFGVARPGASGNDQFYLVLDPHDGSIGVYDGDNTEQARTDPDMIRWGEWFYVEIQWDTATGTCIIHVNTVEVLNAGGLDLTYSGHVDNTWSSVGLKGSNNATWRADDFYVLDDAGAGPDNTFLGDCRVQALYPIGVGADSGWTPVGDVANWACVDDDDVDNITAQPDDETTHVVATVPATTDTYAMSPCDLPAGTIYGVQTLINARKEDTGARMVASVIRHGGVNHVGANRAPSAWSYNYLIEVLTNNPGTGVPFTVADLAAWQVGHQLTV